MANESNLWSCLGSCSIGAGLGWCVANLAGLSKGLHGPILSRLSVGKPAQNGTTSEARACLAL